MVDLLFLELGHQCSYRLLLLHFENTLYLFSTYLIQSFSGTILTRNSI